MINKINKNTLVKIREHGLAILFENGRFYTKECWKEGRAGMSELQYYTLDLKDDAGMQEFDIIAFKQYKNGGNIMMWILNKEPEKWDWEEGDNLNWALCELKEVCRDLDSVVNKLKEIMR